MFRARVLLGVLLTCSIATPSIGQTLPASPASGPNTAACSQPSCEADASAPAALASDPSFAPSPTVETGSPGIFRDLFAPLGTDVKHLASRDTLIWLALGGAAAAAAHPGDPQLTHTFATNEAIDESLDPGSPIGSTAVQFGAAVGTYVIGRMAGKTELAHVGADLVRAQIIAGGITQGIKLAAQRTRPDGTSYSFPSGHTSSAFATATVLQRHYGWKVGLPAYALAGYVGGSRLAENRHYVSDVIFGAAIGIVSAHAVTIGHGRGMFSVTPIAVPRGAGVGLVHIGSN